MINMWIVSFDIFDNLSAQKITVMLNNMAAKKHTNKV